MEALAAFLIGSVILGGFIALLVGSLVYPKLWALMMIVGLGICFLGASYVVGNSIIRAINHAEVAPTVER